MAIIGLTISDTGESIQRLAVSTKVAIGEVKTSANGKTYPAKLDHFVFLRKGTKLEWEADKELIDHYGASCREFWIILLDDQLENVFRTEYAWWVTTEKKCWGDGREATRRTENHPEGEEWAPCGDACPDLDKGACKPSGDLYFVLADFPRLGAVCRLHTTSYRSIRQISAALEQIRTVTGGRLAGIRCKLVVRPEKAAFVDAKDGKKKSTTIYALNIELSAQDMHKLIGSMTEHARLFDQTRKLLGTGRKVEYVVEDEPEIERAPDVAQEFYPPEEIAPAPPAVVQQPVRASEKVIDVSKPEPQPAKPNSGNGHAKANGAAITKEQQKEFFEAVTEGGWTNAQAKEILAEKWGIDSSSRIPVDKFEEICRRFRSSSMADPEPATVQALQETLGYQAEDSDVPF